MMDAAALVLAAAFSFAAEPAPPATPVRFIADTGWQISEPPGFNLAGDGAPRRLRWESETIEKVRPRGLSVTLRRKEFIEATDQKLPAAKILAASQEGRCWDGSGSSQSPVQQGRHYGYPTITVTCKSHLSTTKASHLGSEGHAFQDGYQDFDAFDREYYFVFYGSTTPAPGSATPVIVLAYGDVTEARSDDPSYGAPDDSAWFSRYRSARRGPEFKTFRLIRGTLKLTSKGASPQAAPAAPAPADAGAVPLLR